LPNEFLSYSAPGFRTQNSWNNTTTPFPGSQSVTQVADVFGTKSRTSVVTPSFSLRRSTGRLPENVFQYAEIMQTARRGSYLQVTGPGFFHDIQYVKVVGIIGSFIGSAPSFLSVSSLLEDNVRADMMDKIRDVGFDTGTFVGEFRETAEMFKTFSVALSSAIKAARRRDPNGVIRALGIPKGSVDIANVWLLLMYGIRPFISDLSSAAKALEDGLVKERYVMVSGRKTFQDTQIVTSGALNSPSGLVSTSWTYKVDVSGRVKYSVTSSAKASLVSLGLTNPLSVGWELTKLSFVIDWAIGVGSWLGQLDATFGKQFDCGSITSFTKTIGQQSVTIRYVVSDAQIVSDQTASYEYVTVARNPLVTWPITWLPVLKDPTSIFHIVTGLALLRQRY